jgi:hypothetical protein
MIDEQEIYMNYTPEIADLIVSYETAETYRQVEIISQLTKYCVLPQLDGMFQAAYRDLIEHDWMTPDGNIIVDLNTLR